jgi:hypothetical protein
MKDKKLVAKGWLAKTSTRKLDVNKNPVEEWSHRYASCHGSGINPYVYTAYGKAKQGLSRYELNVSFYTEIKDYSGLPAYKSAYEFTKKWDEPEYKKYQEERKRANKEAPVIGYWEYIYSIVPGAIVELSE